MIDNVTSISWLLLSIYITILIMFIAKYRKSSIICPELFFSFTFLFCTFLYAPLLHGEDVDGYVFSFLLQESNLNIIKSLSLAMIGFLFYILGAVIYSKSNKVTHFESINYLLRNNVFLARRSYIHAVTSLFIVLAIISGGLDIVNRYTDSKVGLSGGAEFFFYVTVLIVISSVAEFNFISKKKITTIKSIFININKVYVINSIFMITLFLIAGYRSALFPLLLPLIFLFDRFVKKIKIVYLVFFIFFGFVIMSVSKDTRAGEDSKLKTSNVLSVAYVAEDFISANQALFTLVEHTDKYGAQQGSNAIYQMVSFIPFSQFFLKEFLDVKSTESSSRFFTDKLESHWSGLGTHVIGDLYYGFGWFGVVFFMFVLGGATSFLYNKATQEGQFKVVYYVPYLLILGNSLMFSRVEFFYFFRIVGFSIIVIWFFEKWFLLDIQNKKVIR